MRRWVSRCNYPGAVLRRDRPCRTVHPARRPDVRVRARLPVACCCCWGCSTAPGSASRRARSRSSRSRRSCAASAIPRVNGLTFVITGVVGGIAGAMIGAAIGMLSPLLSLPLTIKGLIVTVIGGLGSIPGAIIAGLLVGGFENLFQYLPRRHRARPLRHAAAVCVSGIPAGRHVSRPAAGRD